MTQFERDTPQGVGGKTGGSLSICIDIYDTYALSILTFYPIYVLFPELMLLFPLLAHAVYLILLYGNPHFLASQPVYFPL